MKKILKIVAFIAVLSVVMDIVSFLIMRDLGWMVMLAIVAVILMQIVKARKAKKQAAVRREIEYRERCTRAFEQEEREKQELKREYFRKCCRIAEIRLNKGHCSMWQRGRSIRDLRQLAEKPMEELDSERFRATNWAAMTSDIYTIWMQNVRWE